MAQARHAFTLEAVYEDMSCYRMLEHKGAKHVTLVFLFAVHKKQKGTYALSRTV